MRGRGFPVLVIGIVVGPPGPPEPPPSEDPPTLAQLRQLEEAIRHVADTGTQVAAAFPHEAGPSLCEVLATILEAAYAAGALDFTGLPAAFAEQVRAILQPRVDANLVDPPFLQAAAEMNATIEWWDPSSPTHQTVLPLYIFLAIWHAAHDYHTFVARDLDAAERAHARTLADILRAMLG